MKPLILFSIFYFIQCKEIYLKREYSLSKPFSGSWDFMGASVMTNDYIRLTHNKQSQFGAVLNLYPNKMRDWEIHINFKIQGNTGYLFGDGLAFWYTSKPLQPGPVFGTQNYFKGLAIFLDTYSNHHGPRYREHPYISAMVNNGTLKYDHDSDGAQTQLSGCAAQLRNKDYPTIIAIRYVKNRLTVSHDINNERKWKECFTVDNVKLPLGYYFGVSAATGELSDNHDIISIKSYEVEVDHSADENIDLYNFEPFAEMITVERDHVEIDQPSLIWQLLKWLLYMTVIVCLCAAIGLSLYLYKQNEHQKKRLY